ncbi:hypothetical protein C8R47DRAFT_1302846 [Mycena vitilis]|nr:hypothetical protein C8R47DRAFT_1302846 [Mycena vitilis]
MASNLRWQCADCPRSFTTAGGRTRHRNCQHKKFTAARTTQPMPTTAPPPFAQLNGQPPGSFAPFESRTDFDFAHFHFVELQSSAAEINTALDLWAAQVLQYGGAPPWRTAQDLYDAIDSIQHGDAPWKVYQIQYTGPRPPVPPKWMSETYELCTRDSRTVLHQQLANSDFQDKIDYSPYRQYDADGKRVWSNLMSGDWAWKQADEIAKDESAHGTTFIPLVAGSDKTTVSVATGHQEYHPVYQSPGVLTGVARRAHGNGVLPVAFLPIPKTTKKHRKSEVYQRFVRQLYHACLARVFEPLKAGMTTPEVIKCPDGHFRRAIYGLGPYIADYPEQVWLSSVVQNWCPKCDAKPHHLDTAGARRRNHEKTDFLITCFDPGILWSDFGIRADVVVSEAILCLLRIADRIRVAVYSWLSPRGHPRTPHPDLLHQVIKGTFKDHLVEWVNQYLHGQYGEARALEIIADIDHRIAAVPSFPGLRRFPDGRDFSQWTGDDSKALMKVYIAAIAGHVPPEMVKCVAAFMDFCYLARRNALNTDGLHELKVALARFHFHREIFIQTGVRVDISLPRQHSLVHYEPSIRSFGTANGLCSSITESKHIKAVKEPWRRSSRYNALMQMLRTVCRLDRLAAIRGVFRKQGMMAGTALSYASMLMRGEEPTPPGQEDDEDDEDDDGALPSFVTCKGLMSPPARNYPRYLNDLALHILQPTFPELFRRFLYTLLHPDADSDTVPIDACPPSMAASTSSIPPSQRFTRRATCVVSEGCAAKRIRAHPNWHGSYSEARHVFIELDSELQGMLGMVIGRVLLFFSFTTPADRTTHSCALVHWYCRHDAARGLKSLAIVSLDCIARAAHLLPVYGTALLPEDFHFSYSLDAFQSFF